MSAGEFGAAGEFGPDAEAALRADIRRLGALLGQALVRQEGQGLLDLVEQVRAQVRTDPVAAAQALAAMDVATGTKLARAFSTYFHLANVTEQTHRARDLSRRRARHGGLLDAPPPDITAKGGPAHDVAAAAPRLALQPLVSAR